MEKLVEELHKRAFPEDEQYLPAAAHRARLEGADGDTFSQCVEYTFPRGKFGNWYILANYGDVCVFDSVLNKWVHPHTTSENTVLSVVRTSMTEVLVRDCVMMRGNTLRHLNIVDRLALVQQMLHEESSRWEPGTADSIQVHPGWKHRRYFLSDGTAMSTVPLYYVGARPTPKLTVPINGWGKLYVDK